MASLVSADTSGHFRLRTFLLDIKNRVLSKMEEHSRRKQSYLNQKASNGLSLSSDRLDRALDLGYAFDQLIGRGYARKRYLNRLMANESIWSVLTGLSDGEIVPNLNNNKQIGLINILNIINTKLNTTFELLPLVNDQALIYERESLRFAALNGGMAGYQGLYKDWERDLVKFNTGMRFSIINDLSRKRGFFYDYLHSVKEYKKEQEQARNLASQIINNGETIPRPAESPITDMAFPTARDAETFHKCISSFLISVFAYGYKPPAIWVMDDAEGDIALEKQKMLEGLAKKFKVTINYVGQKEKERFLDLLMQNPHLKEAGLTKDELIRIYFQPNKFGSNRNYVQSYCSGRVYSTVDDDAIFLSTIEKEFFPTILCQADLHGLEEITTGLYDAVRNFKIGPKATVEIYKLATGMGKEFSKGKKSKGHLKITVLLQRLLTVLYNQPPGLSSQAKNLFTKFAKNIPMDASEVETEIFTSGKKTFMGIVREVEFDDADPTISVLVNAFGAHSRLITKSADELKALRFKRSESCGVLLPFSDRSGKIGIVESLPNLTGPGSSWNDLQYFTLCGDLRALGGERGKIDRYYSLGNVIVDQYKVSTTTFTTIDNRNNFALVIPGMIDSHPLGMLVQGRDRKFKLFKIMLALDHLQRPSPTRNWQGSHVSMAKRTIKNMIEETGLMNALDIHFGLRSRDDAVRIFASDMCAVVQELRYMADSIGDDNGSSRQTIFDLIESISLELGGIPIPERGITNDAKELADVYLALPNAKDNISKLIAIYTAKIKEVKRYSKNVHLAARELREEGILPFTVFRPDGAAENIRKSDLKSSSAGKRAGPAISEEEFFNDVEVSKVIKFQAFICKIITSWAETKPQEAWGEFQKNLLHYSNKLDEQLIADNDDWGLQKIAESVDTDWAQSEKWKRYERNFRYKIRYLIQEVYGRALTIVNREHWKEPDEQHYNNIVSSIDNLIEETAILTAELAPLGKKEIPGASAALSDAEWERLLKLQDEYWNYFRPAGKMGVPLYWPALRGTFAASPLLTSAELMKMAGVGKDSRIIDLGAGKADPCVAAAAVFGAKAAGYEFNTASFEIGEEWIKHLEEKIDSLIRQGQVKMIGKDYKEAPLDEFTHIYIYPSGGVQCRKIDEWIVNQDIREGVKLIINIDSHYCSEGNYIELLFPQLIKDKRWEMKAIPELNSFIFERKAEADRNLPQAISEIEPSAGSMAAEQELIWTITAAA